MKNQFAKYKTGQIIGHNGSAYIISHAERKYIDAVNLSSNKIKIRITAAKDAAPPILAETALDYVTEQLDRIF